MSDFLMVNLQHIAAETNADAYFVEILRSEFDRWPAFELDRRRRRYLLVGASINVCMLDSAPRGTVQSMSTREERKFAEAVENFEDDLEATRHPILVKMCIFAYQNVKRKTTIRPEWRVAPTSSPTESESNSCDDASVVLLSDSENCVNPTEEDDTSAQYRANCASELKKMRLLDALFDAMLREWRHNQESNPVLGRVVRGIIFSDESRRSMKSQIIVLGTGLPRSDLSKHPIIAGKYTAEYFGSPERYFGNLRLSMTNAIQMGRSPPIGYSFEYCRFEPEMDDDARALSVSASEAKLMVPWAIWEAMPDAWRPGDHDSTFLELRDLVRKSGYGDHAIRLIMWLFWANNCANAELKALVGPYEDYSELINAFEAREIARLTEVRAKRRKVEAKRMEIDAKAKARKRYEAKMKRSKQSRKKPRSAEALYSDGEVVLSPAIKRSR